MPGRDPLVVLARLRALQRDAARRDLATAQAGHVGAEAACAALREALREEAAADTAEAFAAWLPAARLAEARAAEAEAAACHRVDAARRTLGEARAAAEAVEALRDAARRRERRLRLRAEQAYLDDMAR